MSTKPDIHFYLQKHWGHHSFRPLQEDIILSVLDRKDTLALLPTGGGKSICFQIPGLVVGGTCLVGDLILLRRLLGGHQLVDQRGYIESGTHAQ